MNGIDKITDRIAADNQQEITALKSRATQQAASIVSGYRAAADAEYEETVTRGKADAEDRVVRLGGVADLETRKLALKTKQEMLDKAYELAYQKLLALPEDDYAALLTKLAVTAVQKGTEALVFSTVDRPRYGKRVVIAANEQLEAAGKTASLTLSEESRDFKGGLYVQDGKIETNCTFATIIRLQREEMALQVAEILFA